MDKSKLIAIAALVLMVGLIGYFKEKPLPPDEDDDNKPPATQAAPPSKADAAKLSGGITQLQVKDERVGTGAVAKSGDSVTVNYKGTLLDGTVFDQSYGKAPFTFNLGTGGVIKGWDQGVAGMKVGGKRALVIPASLGYGDKGSGSTIPGGATLKFDVELLSVGGKS